MTTNLLGVLVIVGLVTYLFVGLALTCLGVCLDTSFCRARHTGDLALDDCAAATFLWPLALPYLVAKLALYVARELRRD